jgi:hypothetical protein
MSRPSVLRTATAKQAKPTATAVPASAVNVIPKQGEHLFDHDGVKAVVQFAQHNGQWIAEYRFRFRCGAFHAGTMPLTINSEQHANLQNALHDAACRMVQAMATETKGHQLNKRQQKAFDALTEWADQFKAAPSSVSGKTAPQSKRFLDLFSGVGGFHAAMKKTGAVCAGSVELDAAARKTYAENFPGDYVTCDDIRKAVASMFGKVDIVCGGFPCQSFSQAGDGEGFDHKDNRIEVVGLIDGKDCQGYRVASPKGKGFTLCANSGGPGSKTGLYPGPLGNCRGQGPKIWLLSGCSCRWRGDKSC